jgi:arylsulfatase A-like enzyme
MKGLKRFTFGKIQEWELNRLNGICLAVLLGIVAGLIAGLIETLLVMPWLALRKWGLPSYYFTYLSLPSIVYAICGLLSGLLGVSFFLILSRKDPRRNMTGRYLSVFGWGYMGLLALFIPLVSRLYLGGAKGSFLTFLGWPIVLVFGILSLWFFKTCIRLLLVSMRRGHSLSLVIVSLVILISSAILLLGDFSAASIKRKESPLPSDSGKSDRDNVILITIDTQRADYLGCYDNDIVMTESLDTFAREGVRFDYCIAQSSLTLPSHASIMTSTYPFYHGVRINGVPAGSGLLTLAEVLQENGFRTAAFVSAFVLDHSFGLDQGFESYDGNFGRLQFYFLSRILERSPSYKLLNAFDLLQKDMLQRRADKTTRQVLTWIDDHQAENFFVWIHYFDPHGPWDPPAPYDTLYEDQIDQQIEGEAQIITLHETKTIPWVEIERMKSLYMGEVSYMDNYFHQIRAELIRLNLLENTLVVITADHGESFAENNYFGHGGSVNDPSIRVPLIFSRPGRIQAGVVVEGLCESIDIMPTILDYLGLEALPEIHGRTLLPFLEGEAMISDRSGYSEAMGSGDEKRSIWSLVRSDWKFVYNPWEDKGELFSLEGNNREEENLAIAYPERVADMKAELLSVVETLSPPDSPRTGEVRPEAEDALRALGYVQ